MPRNNRTFAALLLVLLATGWAANHFTAAMPTLRAQEGLSHAMIDGVFGVYALGLLPGLLGGGTLSDRIGRAAVVLPGATIALIGTLLLLTWHDPTGLLIGRLVVGAGAGLTFSAGTAWAADLRGKAGTVLAGVMMTTGFALGPVFSGVLGHLLAQPLGTQFLLSATLSAAAIGLAVLAHGRSSTRRAATPPPAAASAFTSRTALGWSLPLAPWVFASVTLAVVTLPARLPEHLTGPLLTGLSAGLALGSGIAVQAAGRRWDWGPQAGTVGAAIAAGSYAMVALAGTHPSLPFFLLSCVLLGSAYGLCLREGLLDLETLAPPSARGRLTGVFYVCTYLGFALPVGLVLLEPHVGTALPLLLLAALAGAAAVQRWVRLRSRPHPGRSAVELPPVAEEAPALLR